MITCNTKQLVISWASFAGLEEVLYCVDKNKLSSEAEEFYLELKTALGHNLDKINSGN